MEKDSHIESGLDKHTCTMGRNLGFVYDFDASTVIFQVYSWLGNRDDGNLIRTSAYFTRWFFDRIFQLCR